MSRIIQVCLLISCSAIAAVAQAQSNIGTFSSVVTIQGPVTQTATGNNVKQDLNIGSAQKSQANSFSSVVTTGSISQTGSNGAQQSINVGGMNSSKADQFNAIVTTGNIEQVGNNGERQELDIGSVTNSTVTGAATTRVSVGSVKQVGDGEIVLGAVKNSNVQQFNSNLSVGAISGKNIRMGSVVGNERFDNEGRYVGKEASGSGDSVINGSTRLTLPRFGEKLPTNDLKNPLTGTGSIAPTPDQFPLPGKSNLGDPINHANTDLYTMCNSQLAGGCEQLGRNIAATLSFFHAEGQGVKGIVRGYIDGIQYAGEGLAYMIDQGLTCKDGLENADCNIDTRLNASKESIVFLYENREKIIKIYNNPEFQKLLGEMFSELKYYIYKNDKYADVGKVGGHLLMSLLSYGVGTSGSILQLTNEYGEEFEKVAVILNKMEPYMSELR